jgi:hypothetical protein
MKKKNWMKGLALTALGLMAVSCNKMDFGGMQITEEVITQNAEEKLGITIADGQTWQMTQQVNAKVDVNMSNGEDYKVAIYSNNPILDGHGIVLAEGKVSDGGHFSKNFTCPTSSSELYIGLTDAANYTIYKPAVIENGVLGVAFGTTAKNNAPRRSYQVGNDVYDVFTFPTAEELRAAFPTSIPADADEVADLATMEKYNTEYYNYNNLYWIYLRNGANHNYQVTKTGEAEIGGTWNNAAVGPYNVYVAVNGNVTLKRNGTEKMNLYILSGHVTIDSNFGECGGMISVAEGATLHDARTSIASNHGITVYNRGTFVATSSKYDIGNNATIYNEASFTSTNALSYSAGSSNTSYFYNIGDDALLTAPSMTFNSTCNFISEGTVNIAGETFVTQSGITWVNNGKYTTNTLKFSAHNGTFYNYCQLIVKDNCWFLDGSFNMMDNSYAEMGTAVVNNFHVVMGNNSGLNIKNGTAFGQQGNGIDQGFFAKDDNAVAYVRLGGVTKIPFHNSPCALQISGAHLTFCYETMNFYDGCSLDFYASYENANYWNQGDAAKIAYEKSRDRTWKNNGAIEVSFTDGNFAPVRAGECSATWNRSGTVKDETYPVYCYAFEDTKVGDYDMNDVVIKAQETANGKINLKVVACGATLNLNIRLYPAGTRSTNEVAHYDGSPETLTYNGQDEVHLMLGAEAGAMVNTGSSATARPITIQIDKGNYDPAHLPLAIFSAAQGEIRLAGSGQAPYGVIIPEDWSWPRERICITQAYNEAGHRFADFAATVGTAEDWYKHPTNWVMNEASLGY